MWTGDPSFSIRDDRVLLKLDSSIYSLMAVQSAGYRLAGRCTLIVEAAFADFIHAQLLLPKGSSAASADEVTKAFFCELNDQQLRAQLREETAPVRALILAHAFSNTELIKRS